MASQPPRYNNNFMVQSFRLGFGSDSTIPVNSSGGSSIASQSSRASRAGIYRMNGSSTSSNWPRSESSSQRNSASSIAYSQYPAGRSNGRSSMASYSTPSCYDRMSSMSSHSSYPSYNPRSRRMSLGSITSTLSSLGVRLRRKWSYFRRTMWSCFCCSSRRYEDYVYEEDAEEMPMLPPE